MITTHSAVTLAATAAQGVPLLATQDDVSGETLNTFLLEVVATNGATAPETCRVEVFAVGTAETMANDAAAQALVDNGQLVGQHVGTFTTHPTGSAKRVVTFGPFALYNVPSGTAKVVVYFKLADDLTQDITLTARLAAFN